MNLRSNVVFMLRMLHLRSLVPNLIHANRPSFPYAVMLRSYTNFSTINETAPLLRLTPRRLLPQLLLRLVVPVGDEAVEQPAGAALVVAVLLGALDLLL